ncbi:hypothetical protein CAEBREN_21013 [Caenorhabditis brenneri]|uniref:Uncharacterized protein n=1 Tax=Caenorhabditis brenneri TaxID=135651 RepID=G0MU51_CAEBE|nr:hypothetical protein CAEBREN_21013 [Caenorhabditis brenneri]
MTIWVQKFSKKIFFEIFFQKCYQSFKVNMTLFLSIFQSFRPFMSHRKGP